MVRDCEQQEIILRVRGEQQMGNNNIVVPIRERTSDNAQGNRCNIQAEEEPIIPLTPTVQEEMILRDRILEVMRLDEREKLPPLRSCDRAKLFAEVGKVNEVVKTIQTSNYQ